MEIKSFRVMSITLTGENMKIYTLHSNLTGCKKFSLSSKVSWGKYFSCK